MLTSLNINLPLYFDTTPADVWEKYYGLPAPNPTCFEKNNDCKINPLPGNIYIYGS